MLNFISAKTSRLDVPIDMAMLVGYHDHGSVLYLLFPAGRRRGNFCISVYVSVSPQRLVLQEADRQPVVGRRSCPRGALGG